MKKKIDKKQEIIDKYDSTSHFYDERYAEIQNKKFKLILENYSIIDKNILDAGCGTGLFFDYILNRNLVKLSSFLYVAVDISIGMLGIFERKLLKKERYIRDRISLIIADIDYLPIRSDLFNSVFSNTSLQNLPNIIDGMRESIRVMKNGGYITFSILNKKLDLEDVLSFLNQFVENLNIIDVIDIEDIIIQANVIKK